MSLSKQLIFLPNDCNRSFGITIKEHYVLYNEYKDVKEKLSKLESKKYQNEFIINENKRLKELIEEYVYISDELVAKVLIDKKSPFLRSIIVNKGSKDKVELGMAVLDKGYLVGKIVEVNYSTARALLVSDLNSKIPVAIEPGNIQSILSGTGSNNGKIEYLQDDLEIQDKSIIYTSGSGALFKPGIPVGIVSKKIEDNNVNFFSNLSQLTFVKLVSYKKENF